MFRPPTLFTTEAPSASPSSTPFHRFNAPGTSSMASLSPYARFSTDGYPFPDVVGPRSAWSSCSSSPVSSAASSVTSSLPSTPAGYEDLPGLAMSRRVVVTPLRTPRTPEDIAHSRVKNAGSTPMETAPMPLQALPARRSNLAFTAQGERSSPLHRPGVTSFPCDSSSTASILFQDHEDDMQMDEQEETPKKKKPPPIPIEPEGWHNFKFKEIKMSPPPVSRAMKLTGMMSDA